MASIGFDNKAYIKKQSAEISKRIDSIGGKLYLEFGGKLFDDYHASRVLPGFAPDSKVQMLKSLSDKVEIIIVINANDIASNKIRGDLGITYEADVLRLIDAFNASDLFVGSVVITHYQQQAGAKLFRNKLKKSGVPVYFHYLIEGYPYNIEKIVSSEGFGKNEYIETSRPLVVVTAPGPGSGKLATCLSQMYQDHIRGIRAGYAKFETFPIWNLPLKHPVNLAYEAATADLNDVNVIDPYHLEAYNKPTVNYNRDVEAFPVLNAMLTRILGSNPYKSPTDMGVNMAGFAIVDDEECIKCSKDEIIRRMYQIKCDYVTGRVTESAVAKAENLMNQAEISPSDRPCIDISLNKAKATGAPAVAITLPNGHTVTGKTSDLLGPSAAAILNAVKSLCDMPKTSLLITPSVIEPVQDLKIKVLGNKNPRLHSDEVLIALSISATMLEDAEKAVEKLPELRGCEAHSTVILPQVDADVYRKLGINLTCEATYQTKKLFHK